MKFFSHLFHLGQKKQQSILSASLVLGITFAISAVLGFLRSRFLYAEFFKCCADQLDVYNAAFRLPDLIFKLLVTGALSASFIPVFSSYLHKDKDKAYQIASSVINILAVIFIIASIVVLIFTRPLTQLISAGFSPVQLYLMVNLTRILLIAQVFFLLVIFLLPSFKSIKFLSFPPFPLLSITFVLLFPFLFLPPHLVFMEWFMELLSALFFILSFKFLLLKTMVLNILSLSIVILVVSKRFFVLWFPVVYH